jgi:hypothetical protein
MFLSSDDITAYLRKIVNTKIINDIIPEVLSYPLYNEKDVDNITFTSFEYDGTLKSYQDAIYKLTSENKIMISSSIQWISIVLNYFCKEETFEAYDITNVKGVLISKNELPFCYIKNLNPNDHSTRYLRISYESIRSIISNITVYEDCLKSVTEKQRRSYVPGFDNVKSFLFGITVGVVGLYIIVTKCDEGIQIFDSK